MKRQQQDVVVILGLGQVAAAIWVFSNSELGKEKNKFFFLFLPF